MPKDYEDVEIFVEGFHKGEWYTAADVREGVENWNKLKGIRKLDDKPLMEPPLWLGHEELPDLAKRTDLPQFGDVDNLRLVIRPDDGRLTVRARLRQVHNDLAKWIDEGKIRRISAEWYRNWRDENGVPHGMTLRRVGCMGGTPAAVKSLVTFPADKKPERFANPSPALAFDDTQPIFSIDIPFHQFSDSGVTDMPIIRTEAEKLLKAAYQRKGIALTDASLKLMSDEAVEAMFRDASTAPIPAADPPAGLVKLSDVEELVDKRFKERADKHKAEIEAADNLRRKALDDAKEERITSVLTWALDDSGGRGNGNARIKPADRERIASRLRRADAVNPVVKLSDADGKNERTVTEFEAQISEIRAYPIVKKFDDEMPVNKDGKMVTPLDAAAESAKAYGERRNKQRQPAAV